MALPTYPMETLTIVLMGRLGMGGLRTLEKMKGDVAMNKELKDALIAVMRSWIVIGAACAYTLWRVNTEAFDMKVVVSLITGPMSGR